MSRPADSLGERSPNRGLSCAGSSWSIAVPTRFSVPTWRIEPPFFHFKLPMLSRHNVEELGCQSVSIMKNFFRAGSQLPKDAASIWSINARRTCLPQVCPKPERANPSSEVSTGPGTVHPALTPDGPAQQRHPNPEGIFPSPTAANMHPTAYVAKSIANSQVNRVGVGGGFTRIPSLSLAGAVPRAPAICSRGSGPTGTTLESDLAPGHEQLGRTVLASPGFRSTSSRRTWWAAVSRPGDNWG